MKGQIGLKFLLEGSHFIAVPMPPSDAEKIMRLWVTGGLQPILTNTEALGPVGGMLWAVRTEAIRAIHTFPLEQPPQQQAGLAPGRFGPGTSGFPH